MANQKQRRRRAKEKRHQYDLVQIDEEGNETVLSASDVKAEAPATRVDEAAELARGERQAAEGHAAAAELEEGAEAWRDLRADLPGGRSSSSAATG